MNNIATKERHHEKEMRLKQEPRQVIHADNFRWHPRVQSNWFLLERHLDELKESGLNYSDICRANIFSVTEEKDRVGVLTQNGAYPEKDHMRKVGALLCYPNPLFFPLEIHSKTDLERPKYLAPEKSISPPLIVPWQAAITPFNQGYFSGDFSHLEKLQRANKQYMLELVKTRLLNHFPTALTPETAAELAAGVVEKAKLCATMDQCAAIEITEGQKKSLCMAASYERQQLKNVTNWFERAAKAKCKNAEEVKAQLESVPFEPLPAKLFVCSPGVWQMVVATKASGKSKQYVLTEPWKKTMDMNDKEVIFTYDADANFNISVAHAITSSAGAIKKSFPNAKISYRQLRVDEGLCPKGADDFIVEKGDQAFWALPTMPIQANVSWAKLTAADKSAGYISFLGKLPAQPEVTEMDLELD
jgi:hypothetical protein